MLMGNSFSLLRERELCRRAAREMAAILADGGVLIVDERNFRYILRERRSILAGEFCYKRRVIYCGQQVTGIPVNIDKHSVTFEYRECPEGAKMGTLLMRPFAEGEVAQLFLEAGLELVATHSDLENGIRDDADFYTYVFRKPGRV